MARAAVLCLLPMAIAATSGARAAAAEAPAAASDLVAAWNRVPQSELDALWADAQGTGGVAAIEPEAYSVGNQAARKKVWGFLNVAFRLVMGDEPIWFPVDAVKRTVCGSNSYWSYHPLAKERDVHPWLARDNVFEQLLDARHTAALVDSRVLDFSSCAEVSGPDRPCLYGEVTAPKAFDEWFCGGPGLACVSQLRGGGTGVPGGFARPGQLCFHGPFVLERVHDWRPEIHPAEVIWSRPVASEAAWRVMMIPDESDRFSKDSHFERRTAGPIRRWSGDNAVELWVAFAPPPQRPLVFDLASDELPGGDGAHRTLQLPVPPQDGAFQALPAPKGMTIAARTWTAAEGRRGLLVIRGDIASGKGRARLFALRGRDPAAPVSDWPFAAVARAAARTGVAPVRASARLLPYARVQDAGRRHTVDVLVRFDPLRPPEVADEELAETYNEALRGSAGQRRRVFAEERPLLVDLTLDARDADCRKVPVVRAAAAGGAPGPVVVVRSAERGQATAAVDLTLPDQPRARESFGDAVTAAHVTLEVPEGVTVLGSARVEYAGSTALPLQASDVTVHFRVPAPSYADEWQLIGNVLANLDAATASERLAALRADACSPLSSDCTLDQFADEAARRVREPAGRWPAVQQLVDPGRSFARFLRLMAVAYTWDGHVDYEEYARLNRLLARVYVPAAAPRTGLEDRCPGR